MTVPGKGGRELKLADPDVTTAIIEDLRNSHSITAATGANGIGTTTFFRWMAQGAADEEAGIESPFRDFRERATRARATGLKRLENFYTRAKVLVKRPDLALSIAARQHPDEWRERQEIMTSDVADEDLAEQTSAERRAEIARLQGALGRDAARGTAAPGTRTGAGRKRKREASHRG